MSSSVSIKGERLLQTFGQWIRNLELLSFKAALHNPVANHGGASWLIYTSGALRVLFLFLDSLTVLHLFSSTLNQPHSPSFLFAQKAQDWIDNKAWWIWEKYVIGFKGITERVRKAVVYAVTYDRRSNLFSFSPHNLPKIFAAGRNPRLRSLTSSKLSLRKVPSFK